MQEEKDTKKAAEDKSSDEDKEGRTIKKSEEKEEKEKRKEGRPKDWEDENKTPEDNAVNVDFMKEKIKAHPVNRKKLFRRTILTVAFAVLFGVIACVVFLVLEPVISRMLNPKENENPQVTFPEETPEEMSPEDMIQSDSDIQKQETQAAVSEAVSQIDIDTQKIRSEIESDLREDLIEGRESTDAVEGQYSAMGTVAQGLLDSMVTVTGIRSDYDWAGDVYEDMGRTSGLIVADQEDAYLILAHSDEMEDAQQIHVTFSDGTTAEASVQAQDSVTQMTVLLVSKEGIPEDTLTSVTPAQLGSSVRADLLGKPVIAAGSPAGTQGSVSYGVITSTSNALDFADSDFYGITTNIYGSTQATGIIADLKGRVIGWIDMSVARSDAQNLIPAVGITEMKPLIEALSNRSGMAAIGVHGTDIPESVQEEQGVPAGCYVLFVDMDSPAMEAGLQAGDVITKFGLKDITGRADLAAALEELEPGRRVRLTIMRQGVDNYESTQLIVTTNDRILTED